MAGEVKRASVNFDKGGRSKGTAEVVFARRRVCAVASAHAAHCSSLFCFNLC